MYMQKVRVSSPKYNQEHPNYNPRYTVKLQLTKVFQKVPEGYIGFVEELPGANTQGDTLEETRKNLEEAIELVLEANRILAEEQLEGQLEYWVY
jgi:predicted RNase H-like HicB family nuclease